MPQCIIIYEFDEENYLEESHIIENMMNYIPRHSIFIGNEFQISVIEYACPHYILPHE